MATDPVEIIETIINNAINTANRNTSDARDAAERLTSAPTGFYLTPPPDKAGFEVEALEPEIPEVTDSIRDYQAQLNKIVAMLSRELAGFFNKYYPLASDAFDEATAWLVNTITNGGKGINTAVEAQLWQRARDRVLEDTARTERQITIGYAAKGYAIPPGAMLAKMEDARYAGLRAISDSSISIAAEQYKNELETVRFAVEQALASRKMAMDAAADYIRAVASAPNSAIATMNMKDENRARMMQAAATWYNSRLNRDEIVLKSKLAELEMGYKIYEHRRENATRSSGVGVGALGHAADVYARTAAAALSSLNSIVSTAANN